MGFKMIYWTPMSGSYILQGSILEKCGKFRKIFGLTKYHTGGYGRIGVYRVNSVLTGWTTHSLALNMMRDIVLTFVLASDVELVTRRNKVSNAVVHLVEKEHFPILIAPCCSKSQIHTPGSPLSPPRWDLSALQKKKTGH